jgi:hypothetical protein
VRTKNELDRLSEFLMDEILSTPDENLLREAVEEFGDLRTFEAEMANVFSRGEPTTSSPQPMMIIAPIPPRQASETNITSIETYLRAKQVEEQTVVRMAASDRQSIEQAVEGGHTPMPARLETLVMPQGIITFWAFGLSVYVTFSAEIAAKHLELGLEKTLHRLKASETYAGFFEVESLAWNAIEEFLELRHNAPDRYPVGWK